MVTLLAFRGAASELFGELWIWLAEERSLCQAPLTVLYQNEELSDLVLEEVGLYPAPLVERRMSY